MSTPTYFSKAKFIWPFEDFAGFFLDGGPLDGLNSATGGEPAGRSGRSPRYCHEWGPHMREGLGPG